MYTRIIPKYFKKMYYIDLLAGAGVCKIRETGDVVAGSALVASTYCCNPFDEYLLVEADKEKAHALDNRMKAIVTNAIVFPCDCNDCIDEVLVRLPKGAHYLAFVDCEGLEVNWSTVEKLLG
jgi:three-Cys-motif partner protein